MLFAEGPHNGGYILGKMFKKIVLDDYVAILVNFQILDQCGTVFVSKN